MALDDATRKRLKIALEQWVRENRLRVRPEMQGGILALLVSVVEENNAEWERTVRQSDDEWEPDYTLPADRVAGWEAACEAILRRMGVEP